MSVNINGIKKVVLLIPLCGFFACSSPSNDRAVSIEDLEKIQAADQKEMAAVASTRDMLTAKELIDLSDCNDLDCVQLYMKNLSNDFFYAQRGEYAAQHRSVVKDTLGNELVMPLSTFYVDVNPQASWRAAHTVHKKELAGQLLKEFEQLGFLLVDEGYFLGIKSKQQRYASKQYPGKALYVTATYEPWHLRGLYVNKVTWACYMFEVYND